MTFWTRTGGSVIAERMRINGSGDVGIGTTNPTYKLDVNGTGRFSNALYGNSTLTVTSITDLNSDVQLAGKLITEVNSHLIPDTGSPTSYTLTPTSSYATLNCEDSEGCKITMDETGVVDGQRVTIVNVSIAGDYVCQIQQSSGVTHMAGAANYNMGRFDTLELIYVSDRWLEVARSNN
jgi:hypothetical protein